ncbi:MAG TPA: osmoprotectant transporter permease [Candidatus Binatia bacterium]|jgi:hypothetical protein
MTFKILWGIDALTALIFVVFFIIGIGDGTVSSFNIALWLLILAILAAVLIGSLWLQRAGRPRFANSLALALAVPSALTGLFFLMLIILHPKWN